MSFEGGSRRPERARETAPQPEVALAAPEQVAPRADAERAVEVPLTRPEIPVPTETEREPSVTRLDVSTVNTSSTGALDHDRRMQRIVDRAIAGGGIGLAAAASVVVVPAYVLGNVITKTAEVTVGWVWKKLKGLFGRKEHGHDHHAAGHGHHEDGHHDHGGGHGHH